MAEEKKTTKNVRDTLGDKELPEIVDWCSTGCTVLDLGISGRVPGGIPVGRITQIYGATSTAKTLLGSSILGYAQREERITCYDDVEHTLSASFAEMLGLDLKHPLFILFHSASVEQFFDTNLKSVVEIDEDYHKIVVVDSLTALPTTAEKEEEIDAGIHKYGTSRAKQISTGLRKYIYSLATSSTTLVCIDQTRDNIGGYGGEVVPGGRALGFYASVRVHLKLDEIVYNNKDQATGVWVKFKVEKNKVWKPLREGRFLLLFDYGVDDISSNLYFLSFVQNGKREAAKKLAKIKFMGESKKLSTWVKCVEEKSLEQQLKEEVIKVWGEANVVEERKPREW